MLVIIASKRNLKRAVDRNLTRRRIRAVLNELKPDWRRTLQGKIYASLEMMTLPFPELKRQIRFLLTKLK
jgi:ribonuclease P protein component